MGHLPANGTVPPMIRTRPSLRRTAAEPWRAVIIRGPALMVAGAMTRGLGVGVGVGIGLGVAVGVGFGVGLAVGIRVAVADAVSLVAGVLLGVAELEQPLKVSSRNNIEPTRALRPV